MYKYKGGIQVYSLHGNVVPEWVRLMTDIIRHRGPDDEGFLAVNERTGEFCPLTGNESKVEGQHINAFNKPVNLFFGHRRLAIIDTTSAGHQPMSNKAKTVWVVYNGEIYNYRELRKELESKGYTFKTSTDTEVLLAAYEEWGYDCLNKFNGMWAFVMYDRRKNMLFGSRDRFGVKPLYYYFDADHFAFASEIKALVKLPFAKIGINEKAVFDYLVRGLTEHEEEGFFKNILELMPSHAFTFDFCQKKFSKWKYYTLHYSDEWTEFDESKAMEYEENIRELIFNAAKLRLRSDVQVGSCLSGGLDSSIIVCVINELLKKENIAQIGERQKVFTACFDDGKIDESRWAKIVVDYTKTSWYQTFPRADELINDIEDLVYTQDIPFSSTSIYVQYRVMKLARDNGVKVLLDGQGGDELFGGYIHFYASFFAEMLKKLEVGEFIRELKNLYNSPINMKLLFMSLGVLMLHRCLKKTVFKVTNKNDYLNTDFLNEHKGRIELVRYKPITSLNQILHESMVKRSLRNLLKYEDRNSMNFSIESRTPFADDINLIEYLFQIPSVYKIHNGWSKYLLRGATNGIMPGDIRVRKDKIGFATPEHFWLNEKKGELSNYITDDLDGYLDTKRIRKIWNSLQRKQSKTSSIPIWRIINLAIWRKVYRNSVTQ